MARYAVKETPYSIEYKYDDGEFYIVYFDTKDEMFYEAAKHFAFSDLDTGEEIVCIDCDGILCTYAGWEPGMVIRFIAVEDWNYTVWCGQFPEWDH